MKIKNRDSIETFQKIAKKKQGICLSKTYTNQKSKLKFKCKLGHVWTAIASTVKGSAKKQGTWCPLCSKNKLGSIAEMQKIAHQLNGECLSTKYINSSSNLIWKCSKGHTWEATPRNIKNHKTWCPYCSRQKGITISEMQELALARNGKCLSTKYVNVKTKLKWECQNKHQWQSSPNDIRNGRWCPVCARINRKSEKVPPERKKPKYTLEILHDLAKRFGGKCLTTEYKSYKDKIHWECINGHSFFSNIGKVKNNSWCPECKISKGERICRVALEQIFKTKFQKSKPIWLRNSLGNRAEFDGYNEKLKLAFEHHGQYHYRVENYYTKNKDDLLTRHKNDKEKEKCALENGVKVLIIPEIFTLTPLESLKETIKKECKRLDITLPPNYDDLVFDFSKAFLLTDLEDLKILAQSKKGECLADFYVKSNRKIKWRCELGHEWHATPNNVKTGNWCPKCAGKNKTIEDMHLLASANKGSCLSLKYFGVKEKLLWACELGHEWMATPDDIQNDRWCPTCANKNRNKDRLLNLEDIKQFAISKNGKCLSNHYINSATKLKWECEKGHVWFASTDKVKNKGTWCPKCSVNARANNKRSSIDLFKKLASNKGGECLSKIYVNSKTKLKYMCKLGHTWSALPSSIKLGYWCPHCAVISRRK